ncbi:hypothetical protein [Polaromonas sp. JS666]|uniref:hypothetical protein n=1 Tax=Polaromonas sp. (strain JS666 / ATCC BAA-500) TaxID=296591 RepID=UPI00088281A2|nr:hypothetical protein [Polaromonas sp. JS666]SDN12909.1 hypothetical protein SAMN05720382_103488 [Polaromonas sp. JS666]
MPRPRKYASDAERVAAYRARHELVTLSVDVPAEIVAGIEEYMKFKNLTKAAVITKLVRTQLLRKR